MSIYTVAELVELFRQNLGYVIDGTITLLLYCFIVNKKDFVRANKLNSLVLIMSYAIVRHFIELMVVKGLGPLIAILLVAIILSWQLKVKFIHSLIANMMIIITFIFFDGFYFMIVPLITRSSFDVLTKALLLLVNHWTVSGMHCLLIMYLYKKGDFVYNLRLFEQKASYIVIGIANTLMMMFFYLITAFTSVLQDNFEVYQIVLLILIPVTLVLSILDYFQREKDFEKRYEYEKRAIYVMNMERLIEQLREHKHDTRNHLSAIYGMVTTEDFGDNEGEGLNSLKAYLKTLLNETHESGFEFKSSDPYVDGLLSIKSSQANHQGIHLNVDIGYNLSHFGFNSEQWIGIIGNLIDNSIDAFDGLEQSLKVIGVETKKLENKAVFTVFNNGPQIPKVLQANIFGKGVSTKGLSHRNRGYGLYIVQKTVLENRGIIRVESNDEWTKFIIEVDRI